MTEFTIKVFTGGQITPIINDLAQLRIEVFREYPYLYDGTVEYEKKYLKTYMNCPESLVVAVFYDNQLIGASTGLPMTDAAEEFKMPFKTYGYDIEKIFYFGESVMLKAFRGRGIYARFFDERESYARSLKRFNLTTFCAVERPENHPLKPLGYTSLDNYWEKRGYVKRPELFTHFLWKDLDESEESPKKMVFWTKMLI